MLSTYGYVRAVGRRRPAEWPIRNSELVYGELRGDFDWSEHLNGVAAVVHCAARVHVLIEHSVNPLYEFRAVNVEGTLALARQAAARGVRRFIFLSSIGVLGNETTDRPFRYDDPPAPHSPYAISKLEAEFALRQLAAETELEVVIIRPPLVYGPEAPGNFATLIKALAVGTPLPLASVTDNRRSFVFVDNLADLIRCSFHHPAAANQTFLVSDDESLSTAALLRRMGEALGRPARLVPVPVTLLQMGAALLGKRDMAQRLCGSLEVNISKTREMLGWAPPVSVDEGLRRTAAHWLATEGARK